MGKLTACMAGNTRGLTGLMGNKKNKRVYLYDTFTDVDGTLIKAHTPNVGDAAVLTQASVTNAQIQSNKLTAMGMGWNWSGWNNTGGVAKRYEVDISANNWSVEIGTRFNGNANKLLIEVRRDAVRCVARVSSVATTIFYIPHAFNASQASLIVEDDGLNISVWYNGDFVASAQSSVLPNNTSFMWFLNLSTAGTAVNSFKVTEL